MNLIITAGGTTEAIDRVRKITNSATGRLGSLTAGEFVKQGGSRIEKIFYVCEEGTAVPQLPRVEIVRVEGAEGARDALSRLFSSRRIDAVVHSMAVSDYAVGSLTTAGGLSRFLAQELFSHRPEEFPNEDSLAEFIRQGIEKNDRLIDRSRKISSDIGDLMLTMRRTPKLIGLMKKWEPSVILVGFKLLNHVEPQALLDAGYGVLKKNACDLVVANDSSQIGGGRHTAYLISPDRSFTKLETKEKIAEEIARRVLRLYERRAGTR
jgi:phosphopantothenate-cysteine ligase